VSAPYAIHCIIVCVHTKIQCTHNCICLHTQSLSQNFGCQHAPDTITWLILKPMALLMVLLMPHKELHSRILKGLLELIIIFIKGVMELLGEMNDFIEINHHDLGRFPVYSINILNYGRGYNMHNFQLSIKYLGLTTTTFDNSEIVLCSVLAAVIPLIFLTMVVIAPWFSPRGR